MATVGAFMESPLVIWVQTFSLSDEVLEYGDICDGVYLNDVMLQIDQRPCSDEISRSPRDVNSRIQNWQFLMKNIQAYYQDVLQQLIVMELPNILAICQHPTQESSMLEIQKVLLLILGCAVQCDRKEDYINIIKELELDVQAAIVEYIKQLTDTTENVMTPEFTNQLDETSRCIYNNVRSLVCERDNYSQALLQLTQERDYYKAEMEGKKGVISPPANLEKYHLTKELMDCRNQINMLQEELEDKAKSVSELKKESEENRIAISKLKSENLLLSRDAKATNTYKDELDMFKEKAVKVEKYEKEIKKYKERLKEMDFYKSRVSELRDDNSALMDAKLKLEDQLGASQKRVESVMDELVRAQLYLEEVKKEKSTDWKKIAELIEENSTLEFEKCTMKEGIGRRHGMKKYVSGDSLNFSTSQLNLANNYNSIDDELNNSMTAKVSRLEMENEELSIQMEETKQQLNDSLRQIAKLKEKNVLEIQQKIHQLENKAHQDNRRTSVVQEQKMVDLEEYNKDIMKRLELLKKQNKELAGIVKTLQTELYKEQEKLNSLEKDNIALSKDKEQFRQTIDVIRQSSQIKIQQLEKEVDILSHRTAALKKNNVKISNLCDNEINKDNAHYLLLHHGNMAAGRQNDLDSESYYDDDEIPDYRSREQMTSTPVKKREKAPRIHYIDPKFNTPPKDKNGAIDIKRHTLPYSANNSEPAKSSPSMLSKFKRSLSFREKRNKQSLERVDENQTAQPGSANFTRSFSVRERQDKSNLPQSRGYSRLRQVFYGPGDMQRPASPSYANVRHTWTDGEIHPQGDLSGYEGHSWTDAEMYRHIPGESSSMQGSYCCEKRDQASQTNNTSFGHHRSHRTHSQSGRAQSAQDRVSSSASEQYKPNADQTRDQNFRVLPERQAPDGSPTLSTGENSRSSASEGEEAELLKELRGTDHFLTNIKVISSETLRSIYKGGRSGGPAEKWKIFVDKIVVLQDKNQELIVENSELRKRLNALKRSEERISNLETRNLKLEVENRKLRKIIESLQTALSGKNPYDDKEYHYYSNV